MAWIAILMFGLLAVAALAGGLWVFSRTKRPFPSCGRCGYDVSGSIGSERCPECGTAFAEAGIIPAGGAGHTRRMLLGTVVLAMIALTCVGSGVVVTALAARREAAMQATLAQSRLQTQAREAEVLERMAGLAREAADAADARRAARVRAVGLVIAKPALDDPLGASVAEVVADSSAARAGVLVGDRLVEWDGAPIEDRIALEHAVDETRANSVTIAVFRDGRLVELTVSMPPS